MTLTELAELRSVAANLKSTAQRIITDTGSLPLHGRVYYCAERLETLVTRELTRRLVAQAIRARRQKAQSA